MSAESLLIPLSVARERRGVVIRDGIPWVPIFCCSCSISGGLVPEESIESGTGWVGYVCDDCAPKYASDTMLMVVPDQLWAEKFNQAQIDKYGRLLSLVELADQLRDPNSLISKLERERKGFKP